MHSIGPLSQKMFALAKDYIPGGVNSPVRAFRNVGGEPFFVDHAQGSLHAGEQPAVGGPARRWPWAFCGDSHGWIGTRGLTVRPHRLVTSRGVSRTDTAKRSWPCCRRLAAV